MTHSEQAADWHEYGGTLALATLSLINQVSNVFGEAQSYNHRPQKL